MKNRRAGFTLVELVVVIAILAILAGVGTAAYSGYIKAANKSVDQQLVGELVYACSLADYANPGLMDNRTAMIVLTDEGEPQFTLGTDEENDAFRAAVGDAMGELDNTTLKYNWGVDKSTVQGIIASLDNGLSDYLNTVDASGNTATVGYADNADNMWELVGDVTTLLSGALPAYTGGELVNKVANLVNNTPMDEMVRYWGSFDAMIGAIEVPDNENDFYVCEATLLAQNCAFAEYLRTYPGVVVSDVDKIQNMDNYVDDEGPNVTALMEFLLIGAYGSSGDWDEGYCQEDIDTYLNAPIDEGGLAMGIETPASVIIAAYTDYTAPVYTDSEGKEYSQAEIDGAAFSTLMSNIVSVSDPTTGKYDPSSDSYLDDLSAYVTLAGQICSGRMDTAALNTALGNVNADNAVIILYTKTNGAAFVSTTPADAWTGKD